MYVSVDGCFWQNEGQYRVLDTSDIGDIRNSVTLHQYLSATDAAWYPLVWGGDAHNNTSDSTGAIYKSYDKLCWQTSSQTLYATNIQTNNIKNLSIGGGIYWNPYVESASDGTDAASITLVRSGVAGGTTLVLSQMNDTNDTIQFITNTAARLYHNNYPILTTQNTYVSNNKGYINGTEITQVNNSDTLDGWHKNEINRTLYITSETPGLSSYWAKLWEINLNNQHNDVTITFLAAASYHPSYFSIFSVYLRQNGTGSTKDISARLVELIGNIAIGDTDLRLYVNNTTGNCQLWGNVRGQYGTMNLSVLKKAWRTSQDSSNIGTFFLTNFSSVQPLPGDGWSKTGVTQLASTGTFNPSSHTHTVFKNNLMIKGTNGGSDSADIHLGIGDSDTGFKWIYDGVCQIYANNVAVGQWTQQGMNWFTNPTVNGNKVWNAGNDGSGSGLDADMVDGYHATDGRTFNGDIHWGSWNDTWSDGTHTHPWYGFDHRYPNTGAYSTTITDYYGMTIKTYNTLLLDCGTLLLNSRDNVGIGTTTPSYKLDVHGQMRAEGFHHASVNSDDYMLLAGGGYKSFGGGANAPIFLGYLNLYNGNDGDYGTASSSFPCLGYSVPFTYTRGGHYCKITIPDTTRLSFYIRAAIASVNYSGEGMDTWVGNHRGEGAWWLHCDAHFTNEVRVKGFHPANDHNDSWWGGNPLFPGQGGANKITVCIFGYVAYK